MTVHFDKIDNSFSSTSSPFGVVTVPGRRGFYRNGVKRFLESVLILLSAPIVVPVVLVLAVLSLQDGDSPFYWSRRVGKNGKTFRMLKLRTMVADAEELLEKYLAENEDARIEWNSVQKLKNDPRITRFGRFLRKTSMDELPQLWNVLIGEMSLVGPRPMQPEQRALYPGLAYYALRPGITGLWQVSDRNDSEFAKRADFDRQYDEELSFSMDVSLLAKTFGVVLKGTGY
ncbi:MAG: sugar transferase [Marinosulfonomonas sp.]|uniref:sugar transferase n=1 Tax=Methylophaga sp. TaxID=2024840 RepID=UPI000C10198B|nr:sugar transferase [Methylophaga sp.]MBL1456729.1 sugar transferase [Methylophaga sp.]PHQ94210.1 MAG: sugar transferase [Marinosulfonomonas sp.]